MAERDAGEGIGSPYHAASKSDSTEGLHPRRGPATGDDDIEFEGLENPGEPANAYRVTVVAERNHKASARNLGRGEIKMTRVVTQVKL